MTVRILITDDHVTITRTGSTCSFTTASPAHMNAIERAQLMARYLPPASAPVWYCGCSEVIIKHGHDFYDILVLGVILGRVESTRITSLPVGSN